MAALEVWYDQKPEDDFNPGDPAIIVRTHEELAALLDRVSEGYVQINSRTGRRATLGDPDAAGDRVYDFQGHGEDVLMRHEVPLTTVRAVLTAYLDHGGLVPDDFPDLQPVGIV